MKWPILWGHLAALVSSIAGGSSDGSDAEVSLLHGGAITVELWMAPSLPASNSRSIYLFFQLLDFVYATMGLIVSQSSPNLLLKANAALPMGFVLHPATWGGNHGHLFKVTFVHLLQGCILATSVLESWIRLGCICLCCSDVMVLQGLSNGGTTVAFLWSIKSAGKGNLELPDPYSVLSEITVCSFPALSHSCL